MGYLIFLHHLILGTAISFALFYYLAAAIIEVFFLLVIFFQTISFALVGPVPPPPQNSLRKHYTVPRALPKSALGQKKNVYFFRRSGPWLNLYRTVRNLRLIYVEAKMFNQITMQNYYFSFSPYPRSNLYKFTLLIFIFVHHSSTTKKCNLLHMPHYVH